MALGFGVGDIIAVGDLARKLYKNVYLVAKHAPQELDGLARDISLLRGAIDLLAEEFEDADSVLMSGGPNRITMVEEIMVKARETLTQLEAFAEKHGLIKSGWERQRFRKTFDRLIYAGDASKITAMRAQLGQHYNLISLLLTSIGNLSLERMTEQNRGMEQDILSIKSLLLTRSTGMAELPAMSALDNYGGQDALSDKFMDSAQSHNNWLAIGLETWTQAGSWWLFKLEPA